ncbi:CAMK/CAMK2 protein kinase, variant [Aphanomyces invadans]|uniref:non-specific serine/threonine protein kinase n=1 Tax=Aphanomyces invadans TaxID=157072 RepID=A0A024U3E0_9STRA|nr:CAMK/CAMK2 protein kinase, variant [Aphanomyces invadans]ETW00901.1 CAMK/CAMK2 protein kinase, variant [Aphanomyces invadans]|eukprot:XP_008869899.1 CAMK/CAMK2 protein kinase, variant [Aphanomyces invadans]
MGCCGSRLVTASDEIETDDIVVAEDGQVHAENADTAVKLSIDVNPSTNEVSIVGASKDFHLKYTLGDVIGKGGYSIVHKAVLKATGVEYAVKCIQRDKLDSEDLARMAAEVNVLAQLKHPNIIQLFDFFEEEHFYYIVTEYMEGGELFQRLIEKTYYTQQDAKNVVRTLLETIKFCHDKGIAHRDLKPENILLTSIYDDASVKLGDFGLATLHHNTSSMVTRCGSPLYLAPEILKIGTPYGKECDIWSIGVITFMLLSGCPPFYDENVAVLYDKIKAGSYQYDPYYWKHVSNEAKHLISLMLQVDPSKRATADQLLKHEWLRDENDDDPTSLTLSHALANLRTFHARNTLKRAINTWLCTSDRAHHKVCPRATRNRPMPRQQALWTTSGKSIRICRRQRRPSRPVCLNRIILREMPSIRGMGGRPSSQP